MSFMLKPCLQTLAVENYVNMATYDFDVYYTMHAEHVSSIKFPTYMHNVILF
jgi:hypothetical protein